MNCNCDAYAYIFALVQVHRSRSQVVYVPMQSRCKTNVKNLEDKLKSDS